MHSAVQTAAVTIISYKLLNFARYMYTQHYGSYMPSTPLEFIRLCYYYFNCCGSSLMIVSFLILIHVV